MSSVRTGAQRASRPAGSPAAVTVSMPPDLAASARPHRPGIRHRLTALLAVALVATIAIAVPPARTDAADDYILMPRSELLSRPISGEAWTELKAVAGMALGTPNLCDKDAQHHLRTLATALVYARTGSAAYGSKARAGVMAAIKTQVVGCSSATLALGRQLMAYVLAADFADLAGSDDTTFRSWLSAIRTKDIGGHSRWWSLRVTHEDSAANWGAHAGASRIAASLYLGDTADVAAAAKVTRGFLGDRSQYAGFGHKLYADDLSWTCSGSQSTYTPENPSCTKSGINVDGAFIADISRGGSLRWPPADPGIPYQLESLQGAGMQVELLYRNGYPDAWGWSNDAIKRAAAIITRSGNSGGTGWNETTASRQMPWLINLRYGTTIPTRINGTGRLIGFTSWLYGGGFAAVEPPTITTPRLRYERTTDVPSSGVRAFISWNLRTTSDGVRRYDLQMRRSGGSWTTISSSTAKSRWLTLGVGTIYEFRARAVDRAGRGGPWVSTGPQIASRVSEASSRIAYAGSWNWTYSTSYLGGKAKYTKQVDATATYTFTGSSIAWIGPMGPTRGKVKIYLDGTYMGIVDLYRSSFDARRVIWVRSLEPGTHTVIVRSLGTSGRPTVTIDSFAVLGPAS